MTQETPDDFDDESVDDEYTIASEPPDRERNPRRSWWAAVFASARRHPNEWRLVRDHYAKSTASQLASDVRNAHRRTPDKMRVQGILLGETWDARHGPDPFPTGDDENGEWLVWVKFEGTIL